MALTIEKGSAASNGVDACRHIVHGSDDQAAARGGHAGFVLCVQNYEATGLQPAFLEKFKMNGVEIPLTIFARDDEGGGWR